MPDYPPAICEAATAAAMREMGFDHGPDELEEALARAALDAVAEALGEHCAAAIAAHAERQHPRYPGQIPSAWDRHFGIAARVAASAFLTEDDLKRLAAQALARGDFIACDLPEEST